METEAVIAILNRCMTDWELVGSEVLDYEIAGISDEERMRIVESLLQVVHEWVMIVEPPTTKVVGVLIHTPVCVPQVHRLTG
jgi:hypothetical protein